MKITIQQIKQLIAEEYIKSRSVLLEMPIGSTTGTKMAALDNTNQEDPEDLEHESPKTKLFHLGAQASQLEAIIQDDDNLTPWVEKKIAAAAKDINAVFRQIMADKRPGSDMMEE
jgi:hypothetical protein